MNFGRIYAKSMELILKEYLKTMPEMVMTEKMCSFTRLMMSITSLGPYSSIWSQESSMASRMGSTAISTILRISMSPSMVEVLEITGLEVIKFMLLIFEFRLLRGRKVP